MIEIDTLFEKKMNARKLLLITSLDKMDKKHFS